MNDRKLVKDSYDCINYSIENKSVDDVIKYLSDCQEKILEDPRYVRAEIAIYYYSDYSGSNNDKEYWHVVGLREETDDEYNKRMAQERKDKSDREKFEKQQLAVLKRKYEES